MQKWEYINIWVSVRDGTINQLLKIGGKEAGEEKSSIFGKFRETVEANTLIDKLGEEGWELIQVVVDSHSTFGSGTLLMFFKRPKDN